jgi:hypothetical protein
MISNFVAIQVYLHSLSGSWIALHTFITDDDEDSTPKMTSSQFFREKFEIRQHLSGFTLILSFFERFLLFFVFSRPICRLQKKYRLFSVFLNLQTGGEGW